MITAIILPSVNFICQEQRVKELTTLYNILSLLVFYADDNMSHRSSSPYTTLDEDDRVLEEIGYVPSFKREFSNLATVNIGITFGLVFRATEKVADLVRLQYHGPLLQCCYHFQHPTHVGRTFLSKSRRYKRYNCLSVAGYLVMDIGRVHVLHIG
jgi:hypothetical protein